MTAPRTPRPTITEEIRKKYCHDVAIKHELGDIDAIYHRYEDHISGDELADRLSRDLGWSEEGGELEFDFVDDMDTISFEIDMLIAKQTKEWLAENPIEPLPIGTPVFYTSGSTRSSGVIDEYMEDFALAQYVILDDKDADASRPLLGVSRAIVNHENVTPK